MRKLLAVFLASLCLSMPVLARPLTAPPDCVKRQTVESYTQRFGKPLGVSPVDDGLSTVGFKRPDGGLCYLLLADGHVVGEGLIGTNAKPTFGMDDIPRFACLKHMTGQARILREPKDGWTAIGVTYPDGHRLVIVHNAQAQIRSATLFYPKVTAV